MNALESLRHDIRHSLRALWRQPAFTIAAVLALTLGIGATTAVFSVVDLLLFRGLPYTASDRLVSLGVVAPIEQQEFLFGATYAQLRQGLGPIEAFTSWSGISDCDLTDNNPVQLRCARVEANFVPMLGMKLALGRHFTTAEDSTNGPRAAAISFGLWRERFGGDPHVLGKLLSIDNAQWEIVAVLASGFELPNLAAVDVVVPQRYEDARLRRQTSGPLPPLRVFARLKPNATIAQAREELRPLFEESLKDVPPAFRNEVRLVVRSLRDRQIQDAKMASWILLAAVSAVLLIACANVANLLLARAIGRQREQSIREALGASRMRLLQHRLVETLSITLIGAASGCAAAWALLKLAVTLAPDGIPRLQQAHIDLRVLLFTLVISLCLAVLLALPSGVRNQQTERPGGSRSIGNPQRRLRQALIVVQISVSLVLLTGATLLLKTLWNMQRVSLGIQSDDILIARLSLNPQRYPQHVQCATFFDDFETRLNHAGLGVFALSDSAPPSGAARAHIFANLEAEGEPRLPQGTGGMVVWRYVTPSYFDVLRISIRRGRGFTDADRNEPQNQIVISTTLADRLFPNRDPIGKRMRNAADREDWLTVIGVSGDVKNGGFAYPDDPEYYMLRKHSADPVSTSNNNGRVACSANVFVRFTESPERVSGLIRATAGQLDPQLPVSTELLRTRIDRLTARQAFNAALLTAFAATGALLAAIGLYGVISFIVAQRTQEIGVRIALGATPSGIVRMVVWYAARLTVAAAVLGILGAMAVTRLLHSLLFGVSDRDPATFMIAITAIVAIASIAAWLPSRRASRIDPVRALRCD